MHREKRSVEAKAGLHLSGMSSRGNHVLGVRLDDL